MDDLMNEVHDQAAERPTSEQIERELRRRELAVEARKVVYKALRSLIVFAAVAVLVVTLLFPTIQVRRGSMTPTLRDGEQIILITLSNISRGDVVAFHLGNQTMVKRIIATAGEWVDIDDSGAVYINGEQLAEPYLTEKSPGIYDLEFPLQVPDNQFFVMGDSRAVSLDSRLAEFGMVHREDIIGEAILRIWPISRFGIVK